MNDQEGGPGLWRLDRRIEWNGLDWTESKSWILWMSSVKVKLASTREEMAVDVCVVVFSFRTLHSYHDVHSKKQTYVLMDGMMGSLASAITFDRNTVQKDTQEWMEPRGFKQQCCLMFFSRTCKLLQGGFFSFGTLMNQSRCE